MSDPRSYCVRETLYALMASMSILDMCILPAERPGEKDTTHDWRTGFRSEHSPINFVRPLTENLA